MKIRMLKTVRGSPDGIELLEYVSGQEYDLGRTEREQDLARAFVKHGWAEEAKPKRMEDAKSLPDLQADSEPSRSASRKR
jgi:hypothetical protein